MSFTSVTLPKTMQLILSQRKNICFVCCFAQMYFFLAVGVAESFLLALMSYDRSLAICNPLRYHSIMTRGLCTILVLGCWFGVFSSVLLPVILISKLPFCQSHDINHFFCDVSPIIQLACSDIRQLEKVIFFTAIIVILGSFSVIVISYLWILVTILEITTSTGKKKTFSTCSSHLTAISIYFGTIIFMYIRPKSKSNLDMDKQTAVFYSVVTPTLNPFIYTLRNNEFKISLKKLFKRKKISFKFF
ncbi:olfactory receptor 6M1-like [Mantella aurantiaca]